MKNDAEEFAQRLYERVPANYRVYDEEQGRPLLSLLRLVGKQAAALRDNLDDLWDNFFIETCDDWVVPYLAALVGTNTLAQSTSQSNRLDVRNTIRWRQSKGTPAMLQALARDITEWPTELAEFFRNIGWSQNVNHVRSSAVFTVDVHEPAPLSQLGHAKDPWAHAVDIRPSAPLDQTRIANESLGIGQAAWGTPGRHQIKNLGFFVHRLRTYAVKGAMPAAAPPGALPLVPPLFFTFDPLCRDAPLFIKESRKPLTRAEFGAALEKYFGADVAIRGIPDGYKIVSANLSDPRRAQLLESGELGIDPELGRFAFSPLDPVDLTKLSVDYVEAFSDNVGARTFEQLLVERSPATRIVSSSGIWTAPSGAPVDPIDVHTTLSAALQAAKDGDVIEVVDSATYLENEIVFDSPGVKSLTIRAATDQRPCFVFCADDGKPLHASLRIQSPLEALEVNGLLFHGGPIRIESVVKRFDLIACTLDPGSKTEASVVASNADAASNCHYYVCRSITGGLRVGRGISRLTIADSIVDQEKLAIGGLEVDVGAHRLAREQHPPAPAVHLERVTVLGPVSCDVLTASECILDQVAIVTDLQAGCIRYSRFEKGSILPRRYQCVPDERTLQMCPPKLRCLAPLFNSRRFGRPTYAQLASGCPPEILTASEARSEIGAFTTASSTMRVANLQTKLQEFLPVGLSALILAET